MGEASDRIKRTVRAEYGDSATQVLEWLSELDVPAQTSERIAAAILYRAQGDYLRVRDACDLARLDWRDVLMYTGLEYEGWEELLDARLGSNSA